MSKRAYLVSVVTALMIMLNACSSPLGYKPDGRTVLSKPDEYSRVYEARDSILLKSIAGVLKDKGLGKDVRIDEEKLTVQTDYLTASDHRIRSTARINKISRKESEVTLAVITEKKTGPGWELRRFLDKEDYMAIFEKIDLRIFQEMYKEQ